MNKSVHFILSYSLSQLNSLLFRSLHDLSNLLVQMIFEYELCRIVSRNTSGLVMEEGKEDDPSEFGQLEYWRKYCCGNYRSWRVYGWTATAERS